MKPATTLSAILLMIVALAHAARVLAGIPMTVGTVTIPMWPSVVGTLVPAVLSVMLWRERTA